MRSLRAPIAGALFAALTLCAPASAFSQDAPPNPTQDADAVAPIELTDHLEHDEAITRHLSAILSQFERLQALTFTVQAGLVTLRGSVTELADRQRAAEIAQKLEHVIAVQNLIEVDEPEVDEEREPTADEKAQALQHQLDEIFAEINGLRKIQVRVTSNIVTLSGEVPEDKDMEQAEELAKKLEGVLYVVNDLKVPTAVSERVRPAWEQLKEMASEVVASLPLLAVALVVFLLTLALARLVRNWDWPYRRLSDRPLVRQIVKQISSTAVFVIGLLLVFELLDVTAFIGALLGTAGLAGLAVGFAFQDIVENYLASFMLSARQPYNKGDVILVDGHTGKVMRMTMRDTVLMTFDGNHVRIPNGQIFKSALTNYTHNPRRRFQFEVGVGTEENLLEVRRQGIDALQSIEGVMSDPPPFMTIEALGDSNIVCKFYGWVDQSKHDFLAMRTEAIRRIKVRFDREGFDMPEPIYRVQITERSELTIEDGDAPKPMGRDEEPLEDDTMQRSINEQKDLVGEAAREDNRGDEDLL